MVMRDDKSAKYLLVRWSIHSDTEAKVWSGKH